VATLRDLRRHLGTLAATLWNHGAAFPVPALDSYGPDEVGFAFTAELPGVDGPGSTTIAMAEIWERDGARGFRRREYAYDLVERSLGRRRAFHGHDPEWFAREFGVLVHEHCEERLGAPACPHYYGLPVDACEALHAFLVAWGQPGPLGCDRLRCLG